MNAPFDPTVQLQITCHDPDEFQEKAIGWDIDHLQLDRGTYLSTLDIVHTANMQLSWTAHNVGIHERGGILQETTAIALPILPLDTKLPYYCGGRLEPEECPVLLPGTEFEILSSGVETCVAMVVDAELLNREALQLTGHPFASLVRQQRVCISRQDQQRLVLAISTLMQQMKKHPQRLSISRQELVEKRLIEQILLSIRPPSGKKIKIPNRRHVAWKAEQLIRKHPRQHLHIEQLCSLIGCSARTLHLGFKERYGTTPGQYARTLALNAVWKQLQNLPPSGTVTEVAMAWGFYHLGRFSQQYRQLFDELPHVTVERNGKPTP
ncbi:MAG: AraC family transcriptional regulator [Desulfobulbaceae bacterium]|nr:AraC family transcriptional regulator [Desulfobulbaceae bacterium]